MEITPKFEYVEGSFDTETNEMVCIPSDHKGTVELCFREKGSHWNIPFAKIELYDSDLYVDFRATFEDAKKLGKEICRRWNESLDKR